MNEEKVLCIHDKDNDGKFAGAIVKSVYPQAHMIGWRFEDPIKLSKLEQELGYHFDKIIICDLPFLGPIEEFKDRELCLSTAMRGTSYVNEIVEIMGYQILWFDHHITNIGDVANAGLHHLAGNQSTEFSAAKLTYDYFVKERLINGDVQIIDYIDVYDCWKQNDKLWEAALAFNFASGTDNRFDDLDILVTEFIENPDEEEVIEQCVDKGRGIRDYLDTQAEWLKDTITEGTILMTKAKFINLPLAQSYLSEHFKDGESVIVMYAYDKGNWKYSLRTNNKEVDVSIIAKHFGGGGHKAAAGFKLDYLLDFNSR